MYWQGLPCWTGQRVGVRRREKPKLMPEAASSVAAWSTEQMMLEMVQVRIATGVTKWFERLLYRDVESKWKNYHIIIFPGWSLSKCPETWTENSKDMYRSSICVYLIRGRQTKNKSTDKSPEDSHSIQQRHVANRSALWHEQNNAHYVFHFQKCVSI